MEMEQKSSAVAQKEERPILKLILEFGPLLVFFYANAQGEQLAERFPLLGNIGGPIFIATAAFMVAITISLVVSLIVNRRLPVMPLVTGIFVLVFGALTLWLNNDLFIKMKPTIVNILFGSILLVGLMFGKSLLSYLFQSAFELDGAGWYKLTLRWGLFFYFLAILNELMWRNFSTDAWVNFKVFGIMPLTIGFMLFQIPLLRRHGMKLPEKS